MPFLIRSVITRAWYDRRVLAWNMDARGPLPGKFGGNPSVSALAFTPDGRLITGSERSIWIWDWEADGPRSGQMESIDEHLQAVAVQPDGRVVTAGLNTRVLLWDPARPSVPVTELGRHTDYVMAVAVLPDGRVVTGGFDGQVLLWDPANPAAGAVGLGFTNRRVLAVALLPDGRAVTSGTDGRVLVWNPANPGAVRAENRIHGSDQQSCSPDALPVMITGHVSAVGLPSHHAGDHVAAAIPA